MAAFNEYSSKVCCGKATRYTRKISIQNVFFCFLFFVFNNVYSLILWHRNYLLHLALRLLLYYYDYRVFYRWLPAVVDCANFVSFHFFRRVFMRVDLKWFQYEYINTVHKCRISLKRTNIKWSVRNKKVGKMVMMVFWLCSSPL